MRLLFLIIFAAAPVPVRISDYYTDEGSFTTLPAAPARADGLRFHIGDFVAEVVIVCGELRFVVVRSVVHGWRAE